MNPSQVLFNAMSTMTNGLISDSTTLLLGLLVLGFLAMGFDLLLSTMNSSIDSRISSRLGNAAEEALARRNQYTRGTHAWNEADATYRKLLNNSVDRKIKSMRY